MRKTFTNLPSHALYKRKVLFTEKYCTKESLPTGKKNVIISLLGKKMKFLKTQPYPAYGVFKFILLRFIPLNDGLKNRYINNTIFM